MIKSTLLVLLTALYSFLSFSSCLAIAKNAQPEFNMPPEIRPERSNRDAIQVPLLDSKLKPFYHGVASGDPLQDRVIIWTRVTPDKDEDLVVSWRMAKDVNMKNIIATGTTTTNRDIDYTVKVDVTGLQDGTTYYYDFYAINKYSIIGRTKTLPQQVDRIRLGVVSCANYEWGYFNAFGRLSERADLDAIIHLGDYFYEYQSGTYPDTVQAKIPERKHEPAKEIIDYIDYATRISEYRLDSDLRKAHQQHPFIMIWDDHETANDSYMEGAENHTTEKEGNWSDRKYNAMKAYYQWMPIRGTDNKETKIYRKVSFGKLLDLLMLELRLSGREKQLATKGATDATIDTVKWFDSERTLLGKDQYNWLSGNLINSKAQWKILGSSVMMMPWMGFTNLDSWEGYPAEREKIYQLVKNNNISNFGVISGDIHSSFCANLVSFPPPASYNKETGEGSFGFEFTTPSISSANLNELLGAAPRTNSVLYETVFKNNNPHFKYIELDSHGYYILDVDSNKTQSDYFYTDILKPTKEEKFAVGFSVKSNSKKIEAVDKPLIGKINAPTLAPEEPIASVNDSEEKVKEAGLLVIGTYPNPADKYTLLNFVVSKSQKVTIAIYSLDGKLVKLISNENLQASNYRNEIDISDLFVGKYLIRFTNSIGSIDRMLTIIR